MRRGIAGENLAQAQTEIDLPIVHQPRGLRLGERGKTNRELRWHRQRFIDLVDPAGFRVGERIVRGNVRLDVEHRRPVHEIAGTQNQASAFDFD